LIAEVDVTPRVIETEGGPVTLVELGALRARVQVIESERDTAAQEALSLRALAQDLRVRVGRTLMAKPGEWAPTPEAAELLGRAVSMSGKVVADSSELESLRSAEHGGLAGLAGRLGTWNERRRLSNERTELESQLQQLLSQIGQQSPQADLPELESIRKQAVSADAQAQLLQARAASLSTAVAITKSELKRRSEAERELGFDAPYLGAYLTAYGPQRLQSPLILKPGEQASAVVTATFARQQIHRQWVGGSQGFSFPIGHTGIRYRVGSFHGRPIETQSLTHLDAGQLVVTNQRIAFIGRAKSTSIPLAKLMHVECYSNAVAAFIEGRENPDFYLMSEPKYVLFMINWFLNQGAS
jgi:hypothetical protein